MLSQGTVGKVTAMADGVTTEQRFGRLGDLIMSQLHGRHYESTVRGNVHAAVLASTSGTIAAGNINGAAAAASTQFALWNPINSEVNLSLLKFYMAAISGTAPGGPVFHSFAEGNPNTSVGASAPPTSLGSQPSSFARYLASAAGAALTGAPNGLTLLRPSSITLFSAAIAAGSNLNPAVEDINGDIVIPPGSMWVPTWSAAGTTFLNAYGVTWEEIPI